MSTIPKIGQVFASIFNVPKENISDDTCRGNLPEWRNIPHEQLVAKLGDAYDVLLEPDEISESMNVSQIRKILHRKGVNDI